MLHIYPDISSPALFYPGLILVGIGDKFVIHCFISVHENIRKTFRDKIVGSLLEEIISTEKKVEKKVFRVFDRVFSSANLIWTPL